MRDLKSLRHHPMVEAWITVSQLRECPRREDCAKCGFPHDKHLLCGRGATFGELRIGGHTYYVDTSNVEYFLRFMESITNEVFHWRDDITFQRTTKGNVKVTFFTPFNNTPQKREWDIPDSEWKSIVDFLQKPAS